MNTPETQSGGSLKPVGSAIPNVSVTDAWVTVQPDAGDGPNAIRCLLGNERKPDCDDDADIGHQGTWWRNKDGSTGMDIYFFRN